MAARMKGGRPPVVLRGKGQVRLVAGSFQPGRDGEGTAQMRLRIRAGNDQYLGNSRNLSNRIRAREISKRKKPT